VPSRVNGGQCDVRLEPQDHRRVSSEPEKSRGFRSTAAPAAHSTGAKTGKWRTKPLAYFRDGNHYIIVPSKDGAPTNRDRNYNLLANPQATIELGIEQLAVTTQPASPVERERLWAMIIKRNPAFKEYDKKTGRTIPLVILTPWLPGSVTLP
jgi:deazaflavin-dependent oxidoreductase (nitroreductase family)